MPYNPMQPADRPDPVSPLLLQQLGGIRKAFVGVTAFDQVGFELGTGDAAADGRNRQVVADERQRTGHGDRRQGAGGQVPAALRRTDPTPRARGPPPIVKRYSSTQLPPATTSKAENNYLETNI